MTPRISAASISSNRDSIAKADLAPTGVPGASASFRSKKLLGCPKIYNSAPHFKIAVVGLSAAGSLRRGP